MPDSVLEEMENFCKRLGGKVEHEIEGITCKLKERADGFVKFTDDNGRKSLEISFYNGSEYVLFEDIDGAIEIDSLPLGKTDIGFFDTEFGIELRLWRDTDTFIVRKSYDKFSGHRYRFSL